MLDNKGAGPLGKRRVLFSSTQIIALGFLGVIFLGSLLLSLPVAAASGQGTSYIDAFFTSTTSVCVTGLTTVTTAAHWSLFGKIVILCLIQLGGLGIATVSISFLVLLGRRITMKERQLIQETYNLDSMEGMVRLVYRILKGTAVVEGIGAVCCSFVFIPEFGFWDGIWKSVFHAVSSFCNAGLDVFGETSMAAYSGNPWLMAVTMALIILGSIGFPVWWDVIHIWRRRKTDIRCRKHPFRSLGLHAKVALTTTGILLVGGTVLFWIFEFQNPDTLGQMGPGKQALNAAFQSVTTRTAGFFSIDQGALRGSSVLLTVVLMFIGGSPAGTAGGIKTTTVAMLALTALCTVRGRKDTEIFGRRIPEENIRKGLVVFMISMIVALTGLMVILAADGHSFADCSYEVASAIGTVGLTRGITPELSVIGKLVIILLMYLGRLGPVTLAFAMLKRRKTPANLRDLPEQRMIIG